MTGLRQEQVGIVGAGALGKVLAGHLARCGIPALICNSRAPATLEALVRTLGLTIRAATLEETVGPEIVVMAVPWASVPEVLERSPEWEGRIIIDATHPPFREDGGPLGRDVASPADRIVALAPGAHVVMAFNTLSATVLAQPPTEAGGRRVIFYSGDHARAKRKVASLISCLGFAPVDLGPLEEGGRLQVSPSGALAMLNFVQLPNGSPTGGVTA